MKLIEESLIKNDKIIKELKNKAAQEGGKRHPNTKDIFNSNTQKGHSQLGQYGVIKSIFKKLEVTNKYYVEFGAMNGTSLSNTADLRIHEGWSGLLLEGTSQSMPNINLHGNTWVTKDNINEIFKKHNVPHIFDVLSIDIDGNDYWVWEALNYAPRLVVIETNPGISNEYPVAIEENCQNTNEGYFGANLHAFYDLAKHKGYELVTTLRWDAFFVKKEEFHKLGIPLISKKECISEYFHPSPFWLNFKSNKKWIHLENKK